MLMMVHKSVHYFIVASFHAICYTCDIIGGGQGVVFAPSLKVSFFHFIFLFIIYIAIMSQGLFHSLLPDAPSPAPTHQQHTVRGRYGSLCMIKTHLNATIFFSLSFSMLPSLGSIDVTAKFNLSCYMMGI